MTLGAEYDGVSLPETSPAIAFDPSLFDVPLEGSHDIFSRSAEFDFSSVRYRRRGYDFNCGGYYLNGIDLYDPLSGNIAYSLTGALRRSARLESYTSGMAFGGENAGLLCGVEEISVRPSESKSGHSVSLFSADRRYRMGLSASSAGSAFGKGWYYSASASRRWGRDAHIGGVFTDETTVSAALEKQLSGNHSLTLFVMAAPAETGLRSAATKEAFGLTGNNLYNPSWGYNGGKEFNSRVRRSFQPFFLLTYAGRLGEDTRLGVSVSATTGRSAYGTMSWFNAQTPAPDYYRRMPGWYADPVTAKLVADRWRENDPRFTQIDWDEIVYQNRTSGGQSVYVLEDRVERTRDFQLASSLVHRFSDRLSLVAGVRLRCDHTRHFKQARDMLGGKYVLNVDQYLIDDTYYGDLHRNDLRDPDRKVYEGDRFGHDYDMCLSRYGASARIAYRDNRFRIAAGGEWAAVGLHRSGRYEKELFPGGKSYGDSRRFRFTDYVAKLSFGYSFSPRQSLDLVLMSAAVAPSADRVFLAPENSNLTVDAPASMTVSSAEAAYRLTLPVVKFKLSGYYTVTRHETDVKRYYDDLSSLFCDMTVSGMDKLFYGLELGVDIRLSNRINLALAAAETSATYESNPDVKVASDASGLSVATGARSALSGFRIGSTPQRVASARLEYSGTHGWLASLTWSYMGRRWIDAEPLRRTPRVLATAASPEEFDRLSAQEAFPAASAVNLFVLKSFRIGRHSLMCMASVNNLLGNDDMVYSGYESMRLSKDQFSKVFRSFDSKYLYAYGRTWYCAVTYKF